MTIIIESPYTRANERGYILNVVLGEFLGLNWQRLPANRHDMRITMNGHPGEIRMPDVFLSMPDGKWLSFDSLPTQPLKFWDSNALGLPVALIDKKLPVIYGAPDFLSAGQPVNLNPESSTFYLPIDIFGSAFFMLTRYEEVVKQDRDEHERFPAWASLPFQEGFLLRPIVDEYTELLWAVMKRLWPGLERRTHEYKLVLTHDVDRPFGVKGEPFKNVVRRFGGDLIRRKSPGMAARRMASLLLPGPHGDRLDPNNTFDWIMDQSEKNGLQSEFYFMAGRTSNYDSGYDVFSPRIQRLLSRIHERGHIIGLHPSYGTLRRPDLLITEAENLRRAMDAAGANQELHNGRQHYLRWHAERTWSDWEKAGLKQDSSVGFAQHVGFRAGTCRSYPAWSWPGGEPLRIRECPLIAMEGSLFSQNYMGLGAGKSLFVWKGLLQAVDNVGGLFMVLWHNDSLNSPIDAQVYQIIITGTLP